MRVAEIFLAHGDLLLDGEMPPSVLLFFAHVAGYDVALQVGDDGDLATCGVPEVGLGR